MSYAPLQRIFEGIVDKRHVFHKNCGKISHNSSNYAAHERSLGIMTGRRERNPEGALYGEVIVFTGRLGITHRKAEAIAAEIGCCVASAVTKKTTRLVEGR